MLESITHIVKTKKFPPILLLFGEEEFLVDEAYHALINAAVATEQDRIDFDAIDGETTTAEAVVSMASAFPFMSARRVVAIKNFEAMFAARASKKEPTTSPFVKFIAAPPETTFLLLRANSKELNGIRNKLSNPKQQEQAKKQIASLKFPFRALIESGSWIEFPKIHERDIASWAANRLRGHGKEIMPEAVEFLIAKAGASLRDTNNEIEKLLIFIQDKRRITHDDVASVVGASKTYNIFELQKAIGVRDLQCSLNIAANMLAAERQEILILTMLTRYFLILFKLIEAAQATKNTFTLAQTMGISAFFIPEYLDALQRYSPAEIENAVFALTAADRTLKSTSESPQIVLQKMLVEIIAPRYS